MKKSPLYTRTGDNGTTALIGGTRAPKNCVRIEAYGTVDELNSWVGLVAAQPDITPSEVEWLQWIQCRLFDIGSYLACPPDADGNVMVGEGACAEAVEQLERIIDEVDAATPPLKLFVLPGGTQSAATAQIARTVARRAERRILTLAEEAQVSPAVLKFVNRLSDLLFVLGRNLNTRVSHPEPTWRRKR